MNIDAYTGYLPMFLAAGFEVLRPPGGERSSDECSGPER